MNIGTTATDIDKTPASRWNAAVYKITFGKIPARKVTTSINLYRDLSILRPPYFQMTNTSKIRPETMFCQKVKPRGDPPDTAAILLRGNVSPQAIPRKINISQFKS